MNDQELSDCKSNVVDLTPAMKQNQYEGVPRQSMVNSIEVNAKVKGVPRQSMVNSIESNAKVDMDLEDIAKI